MNVVKVEGTLVMPSSQPCVHKVMGTVTKGNFHMVGKRMLKSAFIFYLRNEIPALVGGFDQVVSFLRGVWGGRGHVCAHVYAGAHLWAVQRSVLIASSIALYRMF